MTTDLISAGIRTGRSLKRLSGALNSELLISEGSRNVNSIILDLYLKGYDTVGPIMTSDPTTKVFEDDAFDGQQAFVGSDELAVYLKDIELDINNGSLDTNIEIADCQGSDSPNPLHLAMIQEYLVQSPPADIRCQQQDRACDRRTFGFFP